MSFKTLLGAFILINWFNFGHCQSNFETPVNGIGARMHYGFLFAHHPEIRHLITKHFGSYEIYYQRNFSGEKNWHHDYNFPSWGVSAFYAPFPNKDIGDAFAIFPYLSLPLNKGYKVRFNLITGAGASYLTNKFNRIDNHKNIAMSSGLNVSLRLGFEGQWRISPRLSTNIGTYITHFSNGSLMLPNLGLNILSANIGMAYHFGETISLTRTSEPFEKQKGLYYSLFSGVGVKKVEVEQKSFDFAWSLQFLAEKRISKKVSLGAGADLNVNTSRQKQYEMKGDVEDEVSPLRMGLTGSAIYHLGNFQIVSQLGVYLLDEYSLDGSIYNRFGIRQLVAKNLLLNLTLRSHFGKADHVEIGAVYIFNKK